MASNNDKKVVFALSLLIALCFIVFFSTISPPYTHAKEAMSSAKNQEIVILQLKWFHQFQFAGFYAAKQKGFYEEEGLDVIIKAGAPDIEVDMEVSSGRANYGVLASELIEKRAQGQALVLLAVIMQHSVRSIIVRADSDINSPADLAGKLIMLNPNEDIEFLAMFAAEGISLEQLSIVPKDNTAIDKFIDGEIDGLNGSIGNQPYMIQTKGVPVKTIRPINYGIDFYGDSLFTSAAELKNNPARVAAFRRATIKGWNYALQNQSEIIDLILTEYDSQKTRAHLEFEADAIRRIIDPDIIGIGHINPYRIERIAQIYASRQLIPQNFSFKGFIYDPTPGANAGFIRRLMIGFFLSAAVMLLILLILIVFNKKLKEQVALRTVALFAANKSLEESEHKYRALLENIPQKIFYKDVNSVYVTCNENYAKDLNIAPEQIEGKTDYDFFPTDLADKYRFDDKRIMESDQVKTIEEEYILPTGEKSFIQTVKNPIFNDKSEVIGLLGIFMDITEQKKDRDILTRIVDLAPDMIGTVNVKDGYFKKVNRAWEETLGYPLEEFIARPYLDFIHPDDHEAARQAEQRLISGETLFKFENRYRCKDGSYRNLEWHVSEAQEDGTSYAVARDVTENKRIREQLQQAQKMEAIGTLAGGIAHDFNNILSAILGYAELAKEEASPGSALEKDLEQILTSASRAADLVKQILLFSRQSTAELISLKVQPLLKEALKMLRSSLPTTIRIEEYISPDCKEILADPIQVHQIIMNLCTNAYHAMEHTGGLLSIELKTTFIDTEKQHEVLKIQSGEYVEFTVRDTGIGIGLDVIDKIFDPYFTTKETGKGTGMGLAICHGIVTDYGGTITVDSVVGEGTAVRVFFPVSDRKVLSVAPSETQDISPGTEHILFVDDEEILAEMGKTMLEKLGYKVTVRRSSFEALETFQNTPDAFDVIITDQTMPGMTGYDLARRLLQIRKDVPIILCTGYSSLIDEITAKALGIKEFAFKPLSKQKMAKLVRKVLKGKESAS